VPRHPDVSNDFARIHSEMLHRIEVLEEVTARQDRIFQRIIKMLAAAVEKGQ
jgi:hypothetical protein